MGGFRCARLVFAVGVLLPISAGARQPVPTAPPASSKVPLTPPIPPHTVDTPVPAAVTIPTVPPPAGVPVRPLTADEAARIALRRQPNVEVARQQIAAASGRATQARSALLPSVGVTAGYNNVTALSGQAAGGAGAGSSGGTATQVASTGTSTGLTGTASLRQLIFDFNHTRETVREQAELERVAQHNLTRVQNDTALSAKLAFYQYVQANRLVTVNEQNLANRQSQLALATARLNSGLGLPSDVVTAQTLVSEGVLNLSVAHNTASLARVNLALVLGVDPRTPIDGADTDEPPFPSDDVNGLVTIAERQRPEVLQSLANIAALGHGVSAARTTNAPAVTGSLGFTTRGNQFPPENDGLVISASVNFTPFDGGLTRGRVTEARANLAAAQADLASTRLTVTSDVAQAYLNLRTAEQRVATANIEATNATEGERIAEGRYRSGLGLFLDIINAQAQMLTAQTNLVQARAAVDQARSSIRHAVGGPAATTP